MCGTQKQLFKYTKLLSCLCDWGRVITLVIWYSRTLFIWLQIGGWNLGCPHDEFKRAYSQTLCNGSARGNFAWQTERMHIPAYDGWSGRDRWGSLSACTFRGSYAGWFGREAGLSWTRPQCYTRTSSGSGCGSRPQRPRTPSQSPGSGSVNANMWSLLSNRGFTQGQDYLAVWWAGFVVKRWTCWEENTTWYIIQTHAVICMSILLYILICIVFVLLHILN